MTRTKLSATELRNLQTLLLASVFEPGAIGGRIKTAREEAGLTQAELAEIIDVTPRTVQNYESGDTKPFKQIQGIADATGVSARWLLHGEEDDSTSTDDRITELVGQVAEIRGMLEQALAGRDAPAAQEPGPEAEAL